GSAVSFLRFFGPGWFAVAGEFGLIAGKGKKLMAAGGEAHCYLLHAGRRLASLLLILAVHSLPSACAPVRDTVPAERPAPSVATLAPSAQQVVDRLIQDLMANQQVPGASLGVVSASRVVYVTGYGFGHRPTWPAAADTVFRLASVSKTFTAIAALQLSELGALDLDAPVETYVPTFPPKRWPISTRQLLGHLSGIRHYR